MHKHRNKALGDLWRGRLWRVLNEARKWKPLDEWKTLAIMCQQRCPDGCWDQFMSPIRAADHQIKPPSMAEMNWGLTYCLIENCSPYCLAENWFYPWEVILILPCAPFIQWIWTIGCKRIREISTEENARETGHSYGYLTWYFGTTTMGPGSHGVKPIDYKHLPILSAAKQDWI